MEKSIPLKEIVSFLPYGLKLKCINFGSEKKTFFVDFLGLFKEDFIIISNPYGGTDYSDYEEIYPVVRPLSDLTKEITHNGETFVPSEILREEYGVEIYQYMSGQFEINKLTEDYSQEIDLFYGHEIMCKLYEWLFDVHSWIKDGLAVDINTI